MNFFFYCYLEVFLSLTALVFNNNLKKEEKKRRKLLLDTTRGFKLQSRVIFCIWTKGLIVIISDLLSKKCM